ncbi:primosomal replication protein PriC [Psychrobium sp. 1_MG-2023]|uniref:primosomal replication protein PriC n=1 Tax=Psychrobium sp. 1_MG-2023 TaxID=3062624 RepID=UPI002690BD86|nr:primosomal replication protein PriC [Psychrobium sp. 1_MG-2023]MDP2559947.1 primosomal replication protein PriC [Psychrobium sp. 1_MG-2023]
MNQLNKIDQLLKQLAKQAQSYDQHNKIPPLADNTLFDPQLFKTQSRQLMDYVNESQQLLRHVKHSISSKSANTLIQFQCDKLVDQCQAIKKALSSQSQRTKSYRQDKAFKSKTFANKQQKSNDFAWLAQRIMGNSQQLYHELSKHHGYKQKLELRITQLNTQLNQCAMEQKIALQQEVLRQQKRLGQCNKAIYFIEQKIERIESGKTR